MCGVKGRRFIALFKWHSIRSFMKMSVWSLACQQSVFQRYHHSEKHFSEFYPQHGGESQLASKLRHCHPMYILTAYHKLISTRTNPTETRWHCLYTMRQGLCNSTASVCLSHLPTGAAAWGGFAAVGPASRSYRSTATQPAHQQKLRAVSRCQLA